MRRIWTVLAVLVIGGLVVGAGYLGFVSNRPQAPSTPTEPLTIAVTTCDVRQTVTAPGSTVNTRAVRLEMPFAGQLAEVLVRAGDTVIAGQVLARLADVEKYEANVAAAELELAQAQRALADLRAEAPLKAAQAQLAYAEAQQDLAKAQRALAALLSPDVAYYQQALDDALLALEQAQAQSTITDIGPGLSGDVNSAQHMVELAYEGLGKTQADDAGCNGCLADRVAAAQEAYDAAVNTLIAAQLEMQIARQDDAQAVREAQDAVAQAQHNLSAAQVGPKAARVAMAEAEVAVEEAQLAQAQREWEGLRDGPDLLALGEAQARVDKATATLAEVQRALEQLEIKAPFAGIVLEASARAGETLPAATALFTLADPQAMEVETTVIEEDVPYVTAGQPAEVYFDALPDEIVTGTVAYIVPQRVSGDRPLYRVYLALDRVPAALFEGMSADASIVIAQREGVLCLPRALAQASADGTAAVDVWANGEVQKRTITVGLRGDTYVEILSGLREGEAVVAR